MQPPPVNNLSIGNGSLPAAPSASSIGQAQEAGQRQLRAAVANITSASQDTSLDGPVMTPIEIEERRKAQEELLRSMEEADQSDVKLDALQVTLPSTLIL